MNTSTTEISTRQPIVNSINIPGGAPFGHAGDERVEQDSLVEILWRRRNIVLGITTLALGLGLLYALLARPTYTAASRVFVQAGGQGLLTRRADREVSDNSPFLFTQREIISSTPVLAVALGKPGMLDMQTFDGQTNTLDYLKSRLDVEVGKKDELITVSLDSPSKDEAAKIVGAVVDAYVGFQSSQRSSSSTGVAATLTAERKKSAAELADKVKALQAFARAHAIVGTESDRTALGSQTLNGIAASITAAHLDTLNAKALLAQVPPPAAGASTQPSPDDAEYQSVVGIGDDLAVIRERLVDAKATLDIVARQYMPGHPLVRAARSRVQQLTAANYSAVSRAYDAAKKREADLHEFYEQEQHRLVDQDAYAAEYVQMQGEVQRIEKLNDTLDSRIRELDVTDDGAMATVNVIEPARADDRPTGPKKTRALALALLAGLLTGAIAACIADRFDTRLRSAAEVKQHLGLAPLGVLPALAGEASPVARALKVFHEPQSHMADALRALRAAILFGPANRRKKTIVITSPTRGDGRTIVTSSLAISLAEVGKRVLLVDADLRLPMQDWIFGLKSGSGLATLLTSASIDRGAFRDALQPTAVPTLDVLPGFGPAADTAALFNSKLFTDLLEYAAEHYDHIVIDAPPSRPQTDARIIAANCDITLLVACIGKHSRATVAQTRDDLMNVGANVIGIVLNPAPDASGSLLRELTGRSISEPASEYHLGHSAASPAPGTAPQGPRSALAKAGYSDARPHA